MKAVPSYTKILTLGAQRTENALVGDVVVQEKVDGSLFAFGWDEDGELVMRSKGCAQYAYKFDNMFKEAVEYCLTLDADGKRDCYLFCEYLRSTKHNTLKYERTPKNHLVLFDCLIGPMWGNRGDLVGYAEEFDIDVIPELAKGTMTVDALKTLHETESYLGGEKVEGIVIKNFGQELWLGGTVHPLFTKYVREAFKERHKHDWTGRTTKGTIQDYIASFGTEARWNKAVAYLRDHGQLEGEPRDIGKLVPYVQQDLLEEETENIKEELFKLVKQDILRTAINGLPEWYKDSLLSNVERELAADTA